MLFLKTSEKVIKMLEQEHFPVREAVSAIVSIDDAPQILKQWSDNPTRFTKIMVQLG